MRRMMDVGLSLAVAGTIAGCALTTTSQIPLAKNVWQIQTEGSDYIAAAVDAVTTRRAAELTLAQGYDRFIIRNSQAQLVRTSDLGYTKAVSVDVVMFHAREPGAAQAIDATSYLKQHAT